eukprot:TRINITY_DN11713_c0_g1_i3.p2 TRINITY_DN11713_c0_g1~~TRINITY_DN11713_c0_g1_i3.p2  ORF type:complete len:263 (-),score=64.10 TRINITY_DN11713_c0_g1_i3:284-1072(-)
MAAEAAGTVRDEIINLFRAADANGDGELSFDELRHVLISIGTAPQEVPAIFAAADADSNGRVSYEEFLNWIWDMGIGQQEALLGSAPAAQSLLLRLHDAIVQQGTTVEAVFNSADVDLNAHLDQAEYYRVLQGFDATLSESLLQESFRSMDKDGNGWISAQEFRAELDRAAYAAWQQQPGTVEVPVTVPWGVYEGMLVSVEHGGATYHVPVPVGQGPGSVFNVTLQTTHVAAPPPAAVHGYETISDKSIRCLFLRDMDLVTL